MFQITIPPIELWDESKQEFIYLKKQVLKIEHSLVSISKWESKWHIPFLSNRGKTYKEYADYIRCMTLTQNVDPRVYICLPKDIIEQVIKYMEEPMTATKITHSYSNRSHKIITSEIIYQWMISLGIPFECQKWHLNRLLTLIDVCSIKSSPPKKMSQREIMSRNTVLNAQRRRLLKTKG